MPLPDSNELLSCRRFGYSAMQVEDPIEPSSLNAQSEDYIVELRDYYAGSFVDDGTGVPDDMGQYRADLADAKTRLHAALIAGKTPDIFSLRKERCRPLRSRHRPVCRRRTSP